MTAEESILRDYAIGGTFSLIQQFFDKKINFSRSQTKQTFKIKGMKVKK